MGNPPSDDRLKGLSEKYAVPENCSKLQVSLINKELWTHSRGNVKLIWHCKLSRNMLVLQWSAPLKDWKGNKEMAREHLIYSFKLLVYGRHVHEKSGTEGADKACGASQIQPVKLLFINSVFTKRHSQLAAG